MKADTSHMYWCKAPCGWWWAWPTCLIRMGQVMWVCIREGVA